MEETTVGRAVPGRLKLELGDLKVPFEHITLTNGEALRIYDTSGPQGCDPRLGLPKRRAPWVAEREARGDTCFSQLYYARRAS